MKAKRLATLSLSIMMVMSFCGKVSAAEFQGQEGIATETGVESVTNVLSDDAARESNQQGSYRYEIENGTATITRYEGTDRVLNIPSTLGGYTVTKIDMSAFHPADNDNYTLEEVNIPDSVVSIDAYAFVGNQVLKKVTIGKGAVSIDKTAFWGDPELQSITVSSGNPSYCSSGGILYNKTKTQMLWVPLGITGHVTIEKGITSIGEAQLSGRTEMTGLTLPEGIEYIGYSAISECTKLTSVTFPKSIETIGHWAFYGCTSLSSVTIGRNVKNICYMAFGNCPSLISLAIPSNVTYIQDKSYGYIRGEATDGSEDTKIEGLKIYGEAGSAAETYAKKNDFDFEVKVFPAEEAETPSTDSAKGTTETPDTTKKDQAADKTFKASTTKAQTYNIKVDANGRKVTYKSSNRKVKVSKTGKVTIPKNFTGTVKITATAPKTEKYEKLVKTFTLTVKKTANTMKVLTKNQTVKASAVKKKAKSFTIKVSKAQGKVTYKSSNSKYVTVSKKGKAVVKKGTPKGKYKITVTAAGKGIYDKRLKALTVTVK